MIVKQMSRDGMHSGIIKLIPSPHGAGRSIDSFMQYMQEEFPEPMVNSFTRDLIRNLAEYAYKHHGHSYRSALYMIADIVPEVDLEEIEQYLPDYCN